MHDNPGDNQVGGDIQICFLGGLFDRSHTERIENASRGGVQTAANTLQWHIVDGLEANRPGSITILTAPFVGSFPQRYRHPVIKSWTFSHRPWASDRSIGFINLPLVKHFSRARNLSRALTKWVRNTPGRKIVVAYSLNFAFMDCLAHAKSFDASIVTCVVVPDLPEYMNTTTRASTAYRLLKGAEIRSIRRRFPAVDSLVLLTESMRSRLPPGPPHIVMEGIANPIMDLPERGTVPMATRTILYAGTLNARYGVIDLVEAFSTLDDDSLELIICGEGDSVELVRRAAASDSRIRFLGRLPHKDVLALQREATILINPRRNDEDFAKYSFPSKLLEYMAAGRPVIAYKLDGMPQEYGDYLVYVPANDAGALGKTIAGVCRRPDHELDEMGARGREFALKRKNPRVQARRILDLVMGIDLNREMPEDETT